MQRHASLVWVAVGLLIFWRHPMMDDATYRTHACDV